MVFLIKKANELTLKTLRSLNHRNQYFLPIGHKSKGL